MAPTRAESDVADGPTLFLESDRLDPTEAFCGEVFDGADADADADTSEYRVVQLTSTQSFDSLSDAFDVQLKRISDPSEAAVIITTPRSEEEVTVTEVGEDTPLYGFRVNPQDLTGISVAFSRILEKWEESEGAVKICLRDVESLLPYHDADLIYRFLNTVLATLQGAGADVHAHLRPAATDEQTLRMLESLFARAVDADDSSRDAGDGDGDGGHADGDSDSSEVTAPDAAETGDVSEFVPADASSATMSDDEIDAFLESEGHGVLAFGGDSPYAIPMSYGYDPDERVCYLHLSAFDGSEKQARLAESDAVTLVVSRYARPDRWRSVVVDGSLERLDGDEVERRDVLDAYAASDLASVDVFARDTEGISFEWYALVPSTISGRRSAGSL